MSGEAAVSVAASSVSTRTPWPLVLGAGSIAALAAALVAVGHVPETRSSPLEPSGAWHDVLVTGLLAAFVLYAAGLVSLRAGRVPLAAVVGVAVAIQVAPLASPLLLSRDTYLYWDYGRIAQVHSGNPFSDFPGTWPNDPAARLMSSGWSRLRSPYGPLWMLAARGDAAVSGSSARAATLVFRVLAALALLATIGLIAWSTRSAFATALVGWNPLLALHFAGGGHADAVMMAFVAAGLALAARRPISAGAAWVAAVAVKVAVLPFLGVEAVYRLRERNRAWFAGVAGFGVLTIAVATAIFGPSWIRSAGPISNQLRDSNSLGLPARLSELGIGLHPAEALTLAAYVLLYLWILREAWRGRRRLSLAAGGLCLAVAWLMPWYAIWPLVLAAFDRDRVGILLGIALSGYVLLDAIPI